MSTPGAAVPSRAIAPDAVARVVERALTARRPRARYLAGADAHAMVAMGTVLPTRLGDAVGARIGGLTSSTSPTPGASTGLPEPQGHRRA